MSNNELEALNTILNPNGALSQITPSENVDISINSSSTAISFSSSSSSSSSNTEASINEKNKRYKLIYKNDRKGSNDNDSSQSDDFLEIYEHVPTSKRKHTAENEASRTSKKRKC